MWRGKGNGCKQVQARGPVMPALGCLLWLSVTRLWLSHRSPDRLRRIDRTDRALEQCPSPNFVSADRTISSSLAAAFYIFALHLVCVLYQSLQREHTQAQLSPNRVAASRSSFKWRDKWCATKNRPEGRKEAVGSHWYENH